MCVRCSAAWKDWKPVVPHLISVVHLTLDGVKGKWRWRRNLCQIDGENSKLRRWSSEFSDGNAVINDRYLRCHFWMTPYVHNTASYALGASAPDFFLRWNIAYVPCSNVEKPSPLLMLWSNSTHCLCISHLSWWSMPVGFPIPAFFFFFDPPWCRAPNVGMWPVAHSKRTHSLAHGHMASGALKTHAIIGSWPTILFVLP